MTPSGKCNPASRRAYQCPTREDLFRALMMLLPRGRAWQTHEEGIARESSWMQRFWWAVAGEMVVFWQAICSMLDQYFCDTVSYMRPELLADYGLPDACDPYGDICTKIAAYGDDGCAYYQAVAAAAGWAIICAPFGQDCCGHAGHGRAGHPGCSDTPPSLYAQFIITIDTAASPALEEEPCRSNRAGCAAAGWARACAINPDALICLLERIVPAHVMLTIRII